MTRVVVTGRDAPLWLTALALARGLRSADVTVTAVELPGTLAAGAVYASQPPLEALHERIGLAEGAVLRATRGAYALGQRFTGEGATPFLHAWGAIGAPIGGEAFFPVWTKARAGGLAVGLADFSLTASAALNGRFLVPDDATAAFGRTDYGYHLPARAYAAALRGVAERAGVAIHATSAVTIDRQGDDIAAVRLDNGERIASDLFVDASGERLLSPQDAAVEDWSASFPADRLLTAHAPPFADPPAFADMRAGPLGWTRLHPAGSAAFVDHVYASAQTSDAEAAGAAPAASGLPLAGIDIRPLAPAGYAQPWRGNCIAIGAGACRTDPMHGVELAIVQLGIVHLLGLFPTAGGWEAERAEYNRMLASACARIRDFQVAAYTLAPWRGPFWDRARAMTQAPELAHRIAVFRARGEVTPLEDETFAPDEWAQLLTGLGVLPESWPPPVDRIDAATIKAGLRGMLAFVRDTVLAQPGHGAYLARVTGRSDA